MVYNVCDFPFNAAGDGVTDDTEAIQAAISQAAISEGVVYLPAGEFRVTSSLEVMGQGVSIRGDGQHATAIAAEGDFDIITVGNPVAFNLRGKISDLAISSDEARSSGWAIAVDGADQGTIENVTITARGNGIRFGPAGQCALWWVRGVRIEKTGPTVGISIEAGNDRYITDVSIRGTREGVGLQMLASLGDSFTNMDIVLQETGVLIAPTTAPGVNWVNLVSVRADTCKKYGWHIAGAAPVRGLSCTACWAGSNGLPWDGDTGSGIAARGILMENTSAASSSAWANTQVFDNAGHGIEIAAGVRNTGIEGGWIEGSSRLAPGLKSGLSMAGKGMKVVGLRSGNFEGDGAGTQAYGIEIAPGAEEFLVSGCDVRKNVISGLGNAAGLGTMKIVTGMLG